MDSASGSITLPLKLITFGVPSKIFPLEFFILVFFLHKSDPYIGQRIMLLSDLLLFLNAKSFENFITWLYSVDSTRIESMRSGT
jgi:hypothetical protein